MGHKASRENQQKKGRWEMLVKIVQLPKAVKVRKMQISKNLMNLYYLFGELALESRQRKQKRGEESLQRHF